MRLRGYGDGIVAEQAAAFIRAYMETRPKAARFEFGESGVRLL